MMQGELRDDELSRLVERVFGPGPDPRSLAILIDLPDERLADRPAWAERRALAAAWATGLGRAADSAKLRDVRLVGYRNVRRNNADLPASMAFLDPAQPPPDAAALERLPAVAAETLLREHALVIALTELSATAPLKLAARRLGFRAATMPGFSREMLPALRVDFEEIHRRCKALEARLDACVAAVLRFDAAGRDCRLLLDLRYRTATASSGLLREPGTAGNLPSGETYIVPYEGERDGDPSRSEGVLPLELDGELLFYRIEANRAVAVEGEGPHAAAERREVAKEPAYANVAELGLGLLAEYGIRPIGEVLLDEKLGLHVAFGRSDHFGGTVGAGDFSSPDRVAHIDRVYLPEIQPRVRVVGVDLLDDAGRAEVLIRDGHYV